MTASTPGGGEDAAPCATAAAATAPLRRAAASASSLAGAAPATHGAPPPPPLDSSSPSASPSPPSTSSDPDDSPKAGRWAGRGLVKSDGGGKAGPARETAPFLAVSAGRARAGRPLPPTVRRVAAAFAVALAAAAVIGLIISRPWLVAGWALREGGPVLRAGRDWGGTPQGSGGGGGGGARGGGGGGGAAAAATTPAPQAQAQPPPPPPPPPPSRIPRIVHQTWRGSEASLPPAWAAARAKCAALHPDWTFKLWSDGDARALVARVAPGLLDTYDAYPDAIQRADVMRYVALWAEGGVYLDLDVECVRPMDGLLAPPAVLPPRRGGDGGGSGGGGPRHAPHSLRPPSAVLPITWPVSLSNDVMAAEPGSPLMAALIAAAPGAAAATRRWPRYARVMFSTGPMFVTAVATGRGGAAAAGVLGADLGRPGAAPLFGVLPPGLYGKYGAHGVRLGEPEVAGGGDGGGLGGEGAPPAAAAAGPTAAAAAAAPSTTPLPLFTHLHGSSWHGSDAAAAIWAAHHGWALGGWGAVLGVAVLSAGGVAYVRSARAAAAVAAAAAAELAAASAGRRRAPPHHHHHHHRHHRRRPSSADAYRLIPAGAVSALPHHPALDAAAKMC